MKIEDHYQQFRESMAVIDECISRGLQERQRNIGFNTSAASADLLEILLHKLNLIDPGFLVKHDWFNSQNKLKEKFAFDFPRKDEILKLITKIEGKRNILCYGRPQDLQLLKEVINDFNKLKKIFREVGVDEF